MDKLRTAVIVGNGPSRKDIDLNKFRQFGPIFGCNALYRDFDPDYLIAFDMEIVKEISESKFDQSKLIIPPIEERYESFDFHKIAFRPRNNAGMVAMNEAIKRNYNDLICIGMDFLLEDKNHNTLNIYDNTRSYGPETRASYFDTINRCRYFQWFVNQHPKTQFTMLFPDSCKNVSYRTIDAKNIRVEGFYEKEETNSQTLH